MRTSHLCTSAGAAEILAWDKRWPALPPRDLQATLNRGGVKFGLQFASSRTLSPWQFLEKLSNELRIKCSAAGASNRVGYKAAGYPCNLVRILSEFDIQACTVNSIMDKSEESACEISGNGKDMGQGRSNVAGGIVALGKFDALHVGHRALAEQAARMGTPYLLSFTGMAEVFGWEKRLPIVAPCDRERVISMWSKHCGGASVREFSLQFSRVRSLSPREFLEKLANELKVKGVVAGANYRFGYKASGDASDLVQICSELCLQSFIVDPVMDESEGSACEISDKSREKGQVSSTRIRRALASGDMKAVVKLLGRTHRLVLTLDNSVIHNNELQIPLTNAQNQFPKEGTYSCSMLDDNEFKVNGSRSAPWTHQAEVKISGDFLKIRLRDAIFEESTSLRRNKTISLDIEA